jgi:hypothetical protein
VPIQVNHFTGSTRGVNMRHNYADPLRPARNSRWHYRWTALHLGAIHAAAISLGLEKDLQAQLDPSRNIALAAGMTKISISVIRQPELIHRAEESAVEDVASIGLEPNVPALAEVGVLVK